MAFFVSVMVVWSLCFVKYDLSLCVSLCATSILNGLSCLADEMCCLLKVKLLSYLTVQ